MCAQQWDFVTKEDIAAKPIVGITRFGYPCFVGFKKYASTGISMNMGCIES